MPSGCRMLLLWKALWACLGVVECVCLWVLCTWLPVVCIHLESVFCLSDAISHRKHLLSVCISSLCASLLLALRCVALRAVVRGALYAVCCGCS